MQLRTRTSRTIGIMLIIVVLAGSGLLVAERATVRAAAHAHPARISMTILPGGHLTSGHAAQLVAMAVPAERDVTVSIRNFDPAAHTFAIPGLGIIAQIAASPRRGRPTVTTFDFQPRQPGMYRWLYVRACSGVPSRTTAEDGHSTGMLRVSAG